MKWAKKKLGGYLACFGDIAQNIAKMAGLLLIFRGEPVTSLQKLAQTFRLILRNNEISQKL